MPVPPKKDDEGALRRDQGREGRGDEDEHGKVVGFLARHAPYDFVARHEERDENDDGSGRTLALVILMFAGTLAAFANLIV